LVRSWKAIMCFRKEKPPGALARRCFLEGFSSFSENHIKEPQVNDPRSEAFQSAQDRALYVMYALALAASISVWFIAVRSPLWTDELGSYWQISAGFSAIWPRQFWTISSPEYAYFLWAWAKLFGTSEIALRIPSILAMLGAVYLLYLVARELFDRDCAMLAVIVFCLHPVVVFASIDVRPYAFAALVTNAAILILVRLRRNSSNWLAFLFGLSAACIVWFHFLFIVILPALLLCFFAFKISDRKALWRQFSIAFAVFAFAILPVIPGMIYLFRTSQIHVCAPPPSLAALLLTLAPVWLLPSLCVAGFVAFLVFALTPRKRDSQNHVEGWRILLCASLALIPVLILYGVSAGTSVRIYAARHELIAVPGIALCWAWVVSRFHFRVIRLLFCVMFVTGTAFQVASSPNATLHDYPWKNALEYVEKNASADNAPVLFCSPFIEADYVPMPLNSAKDSKLFAPLSYYKLSVPVVPLPQSLNEEAMRVSSRFLQDAARKQERFLAVEERLPSVTPASFKTLDWLAQSAAATHSVRTLGVFDGIEVMEFVPRTEAAASR